MALPNLWKLALDFLRFDACYYNKRYEYVASQARYYKLSSINHYNRYGRSENRSSRFTLIGLQHIRLLAKTITPEANFLSGMHFFARLPDSCNNIKACLLTFDGIIPHIVRSITIERNSCYAHKPIQINWTAIPDSRNKTYFLFIVSSHWLMPFAVDEMVFPLIYSAPHSASRLPTAVCVSPVTQCNLNCIHCISRTTRTRVAELKEAHWEQIRAGTTSGEIRHISSDYSGDLFFTSSKRLPWLDRFIDTGVELRFDTHANDLTPDVVDKLLKSRLRSITFSIDSLDDCDYQKIRKGAKPLQEVIENIRYFMDQRNRYRVDIDTILSFALMKRNVNSVFKGIELAAELNISFIQGNHLMAFSDDMLAESLIDSPALYRQYYDKLHQFAAQKKVGLFMPEPIANSLPRDGHSPCSFVWDATVVLGNGDVMACCMPGTKMGNLDSESLEQIWNGDKYKRFRIGVNSSDPPTVCRTCPIYRHSNNFKSYVPGLSEVQKIGFESSCIDQYARN